RSLSSNIPGALLLGLVTAEPCRWTPQWAIAQARRHNDSATTLARLAASLPEDQRKDVLAEALSSAQAISDEFWRAHALAGLAAHLPPELLAEALSSAQAISDELSRAQALAALAAHLPEDQRKDVLAEALSSAQAISDEDSRARALAALAAHLPEDQRKDV